MEVDIEEHKRIVVGHDASTFLGEVGIAETLAGVFAFAAATRESGGASKKCHGIDTHTHTHTHTHIATEPPVFRALLDKCHNARITVCEGVVKACALVMVPSQQKKSAPFLVSREAPI